MSTTTLAWRVLTDGMLRTPHNSADYKIAAAIKGLSDAATLDYLLAMYLEDPTDSEEWDIAANLLGLLLVPAVTA